MAVHQPNRRTAAILCGILAVGIGLRLSRVDTYILWEDEAESSINALTILEHGYPVAVYQGLPLFENTLVTPWPESSEYEFRDISYSDTGFAVYHGWLPLYAMAASLRAFGIRPDSAANPPRLLHGREDAWLRTVAPRVPAVVFSGLFLVGLFALADAVHGRTVAWICLSLGALADNLISFATTARYYSATLALLTLCSLFLWRVWIQQRPRNLAYLVIALIALFHTHVLAFGVMSLLFAFVSVEHLRRRRPLLTLVLSWTAVAAGTVPWMLLTGFLDTVGTAPGGMQLLTVPDDLVRYLQNRAILMAIVGMGMATIVILTLRSVLSRAVDAAAVIDRWKGIGFVTVWTLLTLACFVILSPAASMFPNRLGLLTAVPGLLLFSNAVVAVVQFLPRDYRRSVAVAVALSVFIATGRITFEGVTGDELLDAPTFTFADWAADWQLPPDTRIYGNPNKHLVIAYYTGLPVQSIAPVRKSFLDNTSDNVVIIDTAVADSPIPLADIVSIAAGSGTELSEDEAVGLMRVLERTVAVQRVSGYVAEVFPPPRELSELEERVHFAQRAQMRRELMRLKEEAPVFRGYDLDSWADWWPVFFYRFSDVEGRWKENLNYRGRIGNMTATVLDWGWVIYESPVQRWQEE